MRRFALVVVLASACGRVGFDAPGDAAPSSPVTFVGPVVQQIFNGMTDTFPLQAAVAGDLVLVDSSCNRPPTAPTNVILSAPGWAFTEIGTITFALHTDAEPFYSATLFAIAPDTIATTATITWGAGCLASSDNLGDEFSGVAANPIDTFTQTAGSGDCAAMLTTAHADGALWAACYSSAGITGEGPGFTEAADDMNGDYAEYELTSAPAGTRETLTFANAGNTYMMSAVAIAPR